MAVGAEEELDVLHTSHEAIQPLLLITEEGVGGDDDLPLTVPHTPADQACVGELGGNVAVEEGRVRHRAERLMFPQDPRLLTEGAVGIEELDRIEVARPQIVGQRQRLIFHTPRADLIGAAQRRCPHEVVSAGDEVHVGRRRKTIGIQQRRTTGVRGANRIRVHADVALEHHAHTADFRRVGARRVSMVTNGERYGSDLNF